MSHLIVFPTTLDSKYEGQYTSASNKMIFEREETATITASQ